MNHQEHWNTVYSTKTEDDISWHQDVPETSLRFIANTGVAHEDGVVDAGGGSSLLAAHLIRSGYHPVTVIDISAAALNHAKERSGAAAESIEWVEADVTRFRPPRTYGIWHDRAVFHFLTEKEDRANYVHAMRRALKPGGHAILATFAPDGPEKCSGLPVRGYDAALITRELGHHFALLEELQETHLTPWKSEQRFRYFHLRKIR